MLTGLIIEICEKQNTFVSTNSNEDIPMLRLRFHALTVHIPMRDILNGDDVRGPHLVPQRSELIRHLQFALVMLDGDDGGFFLVPDGAGDYLAPFATQANRSI